MTEDISIRTEKNSFKFRVTGIIEHNGKILLQNNKQRLNAYVYPGGHVSFGETTKDAILREIKEEVGFDCKIENLICVDENLYNKNGKNFQEINYYFKLSLVDFDNYKNFETDEIDNGEHKHHIFEWIDKRDLLTENVLPNHIANLLNTDSLNKIIISDERK